MKIKPDEIVLVQGKEVIFDRYEIEELVSLMKDCGYPYHSQKAQGNLAIHRFQKVKEGPTNALKLHPQITGEEVVTRPI